ncbi:MAG: GFA family protein [Kofleriaceae bacterium]
MTKLYTGSCHCGAVAFEISVDLATETSRCNCSICTKTRLWKVGAPAADFRLVRGEDSLADYRFGDQKILHQFCRVCGVKLFGSGTGEDGPFTVVSVATLDATEPELADAKITYQDGRTGSFDREPPEHRYL